MQLCSDNIIIIINCAAGPELELCCAKQEVIWTNGAPYELIKNTGSLYRPTQSKLLVETSNNSCSSLHVHVHV